MIKTSIHFFLIFSILLTIGTSCESVNASENDFDLRTLSAKGQSSYQKILSAKIFALVGVGEGGEKLDETISLEQIITEKEAEKALQSLLRKASPEGQIYALYGFKLLKSELLASELEYYKSLPQLPKRNLDDPFRRTSEGEIASMSGCKPDNLKQAEIIEELEKIIRMEDFKQIDFNPQTLSAKGQNAFQLLLVIEDFSFGLVGYAAQVPGGLIALDDLRNEKNAEKAFQYLVRNAKPEGQLYALVGLQIIKSKEFAADFAAYKKLPPIAPRKLNDGNWQLGEGEISTTSGCMVESAKQSVVVVNLEKGKYAEAFSSTLKFKK